ncbi:DUF418 domain-containing protein [Corynebacterium mendelii]|uniref:DUF418 domain-containing protein n=1 Tax=Corynebacterium mendelii TaxID=2765362 RepID=A0A939DY27_9CORY|nr:DUF418 domain-containing protein [Corynebacterium mendelii]
MTENKPHPATVAPAAEPANTRRGRSTVAPQARLIAPDLARGLTLLSIAMANATVTWGRHTDTVALPDLGGITGDGTADKLAIAFGILFTHVRGLPLFSTLMGYGTGMLALSLWRRGYPVGAARAVLIRRYGLLSVIGVAHMVLAYLGDIMFFYGVAGILLAALMVFRDKTLYIIAAILGSIGLVVFGAGGLLAGTGPMAQGTVSATAVSYPLYVLVNVGALIVQIVMVPVEIITVFPVILIGFIWGRNRVISNARQHKPLLITAAVIGVAANLATAVPAILALYGFIDASWVERAGTVNAASGMLTGPGSLALIVLVCMPLQRRISAAVAAGNPRPIPAVLVPFVALGRRSMTGYVLQSVLFVALLTPFTLDLGQDKGALWLTLTATAVWAVTVVVAWALELADLPGPLEWVHRRLAYGNNGLQGHWRPDHPLPVRPGELIVCSAADNPTMIIDAPGQPPRPYTPRQQC